MQCRDGGGKNKFFYINFVHILRLLQNRWRWKLITIRSDGVCEFFFMPTWWWLFTSYVLRVWDGNVLLYHPGCLAPNRRTESHFFGTFVLWEKEIFGCKFKSFYGGSRGGNFFEWGWGVRKKTFLRLSSKVKNVK
jgi:hypothetical protein